MTSLNTTYCSVCEDWVPRDKHTCSVIPAKSKPQPKKPDSKSPEK